MGPHRDKTRRHDTRRQKKQQQVEKQVEEQVELGGTRHTAHGTRDTDTGYVTSAAQQS